MSCRGGCVSRLSLLAEFDSELNKTLPDVPAFDTNAAIHAASIFDRHSVF
jgi:hypothetical protein